MMKNYKILVLSLALIAACKNQTGDKNFSETSNAKIDLIQKKIFQKIEVNGLGMLKDLKIESVEKINDSVFKGTHTFLNPFVDKEMRVTKNYTFSPELDTIVNTKDLKTEMKSQGEWVDSGF